MESGEVFPPTGMAPLIESMELFGREVVPQFDTDPVHRTTRMREAAASAPVLAS